MVRAQDDGEVVGVAGLHCADLEEALHGVIGPVCVPFNPPGDWPAARTFHVVGPVGSQRPHQVDDGLDIGSPRCESLTNTQGVHQPCPADQV